MSVATSIVAAAVGNVSAGLAALRAVAGRQAKELDPDEIKERLARIAGRELGAEYAGD